ncbi:hypothetical protein M3C31_01975 [Staphylococcus hominis]|uniref:hypothetical protein n=1 Tax=Staphylococcus hominis TaxID=1290 RepID=UPI0021A3F5F0|nr:hypothetical protein [Staphylococcus hominis]MCT1482617.1 hypothetical protein [Staphylococcus hominis]
MSELYEYNPGQISEEELAMIKLEEERFEQALRQRQQQVRLARKRRSEENLRKYSVRGEWFEHLENNNLIATVKTDRYGRVQRG